MRRSISVPVIVLSLVALAVSTNPAQAQGGDRAAAQVLFDEGKKLRDEGKIDQACAKFAESLRLDPATGTRFNLADCYERIGRIATAWSYFLEVVAATEMAGQHKRADIARRRAAALKPRLPRLRIEPTERIKGMAITLDGTVVGQAAWGTAVPVDLGAHGIEASAPGWQTWKKTVTIEREAQVLTVAVPALRRATEPAASAVGAPAAAPSTAAPAADAAPERGSTLATVGLVIGGVGIVGLGIGAAFGFVAMSKKSEVDELCPDENNCTVEGIELNDEAKTAGTVSTVGLAAGGALLVGGLVMWLVAPPDDEGPAEQARSVVVLPLVDGTGPGFAVQGRW